MWHLFFCLILNAATVYNVSAESLPTTPDKEQTFLITKDQILAAAEHAGHQAEKKLKDLLRADYHTALGLYYLSREKAGFMALERFELALERALGDIREAAYIKEKEKRFEQLLTAFQNWQNAFYRARFRDAPPAQ